MKYFLVFILLLISTIGFSQEDTMLIDTVSNKEISFDFFSSDYLNILPSSNFIVESKQIDYFKQYFFLFLLNLLCIATLLLNFSKFKLKRTLSTIFNINLLKQLAQSESKKENSYLYAYFILFYICLLVLFFTLSKVFNFDIDLLTVAIGLITFFLFDMLINFLTTFIFRTKEVLDTIYYNNISIMLISIPIIIVSILLGVYLPVKIATYIIIVGLVILAIIYFWKEIRNILILRSFKIKIVSFYFFLYLCTFKILPIAILLKYISSKL